MKKVYQKPILIVDTYNMVQSIAAGGCTIAGGGSLGTPTWGDPASCTWDLDDDKYFTIGTGSPCNEDGDKLVIGCYHAPKDTDSIWGS